MTWAVHVAGITKISNVYKILVYRSERMKLFEIVTRRNNINVYTTELGDEVGTIQNFPQLKHKIFKDRL